MKILLVVLALLLACGMLAAHGKLPPAFAPGLEGSMVANLTAHICDSGWGRGHAAKASMHRCCRLRACCYARLAARRCRVGQSQRLAASRAGGPACRLGTRCQRGACKCERATRLCWARSRALLKCQGRGRRC
nr:phospholipase A2, membrane associated-like isoform X1 [Anser cygnoides]XP_047923361.1 phospholipase A2, membrane associated-like isoform X1 [Anser cygnoides]